MKRALSGLFALAVGVLTCASGARAPGEVGGSPAPASALTVVATDAPRLPPAVYDTAGTYVQVRQGRVRLTAVNRALRRRVAADQRAYVARARRQRARGQRGVYRLAIVHRYASASTVVVSALLRAKREAFPGQHEGDGWLALTVRVPSGRNVSITDLFARPARGIRALAIEWRKRIRRTPARPCLEIYRDHYRATVSNYGSFALSPSGLAIGSSEIAACYRLVAVVPYAAVQPQLSQLGRAIVDGVRAARWARLGRA